MIEKLRLDRYLWAIRIFKTRSLASAAIDSGKVKINETSVKPARTVNIGDRYTIRTPERNWNIEVTALLQNRVAFPEAIKHYKTTHPKQIKYLRKNYQRFSSPANA